MVTVLAYWLIKRIGTPVAVAVISILCGEAEGTAVERVSSVSFRLGFEYILTVQWCLVSFEIGEMTIGKIVVQPDYIVPTFPKSLS